MLPQQCPAQVAPCKPELPRITRFAQVTHLRCSASCALPDRQPPPQAGAPQQCRLNCSCIRFVWGPQAGPASLQHLLQRASSCRRPGTCCWGAGWSSERPLVPLACRLGPAWLMSGCSCGCLLPQACRQSAACLISAHTTRLQPSACRLLPACLICSHNSALLQRVYSRSGGGGTWGVSRLRCSSCSSCSGLVWACSTTSAAGCRSWLGVGSCHGSGCLLSPLQVSKLRSRLPVRATTAAALGAVPSSDARALGAARRGRGFCGANLAP